MSSVARPPSPRMRGVARAVRRAPAHRKLTEAILPRLRGSATVVDLVSRLMGDAGRLGGASHPLRAGKDVDRAGADRWPIVIVALDDPDGAHPPTAEQVQEAIEEVATLQRRLSCFRVVFLVAADHHDVARRSGHPVEILPAVEDLDDVGAARSIRARRLVSMTDHYRAWMVFDIPLSVRPGLTPSERDLLQALPAYLVDQHDLNGLPDLPGITDVDGAGRRG